EDPFTFPHVQNLRSFPKSELLGKVVMVRMDSMIISRGMKEHQWLPDNAFSTIIYLQKAGARVVLVSSWNANAKSSFHSEASPSVETVAMFLSLVLGVEVVPVKFFRRSTFTELDHEKNQIVLLLDNLFSFKEERANCPKFARELSSAVDIIVNDAFSESHKVLASTVGVASHTYAYIAGFFFEENLCKMKNIIDISERPYMTIVTGNNLDGKAAALHTLISICDGLIFVGTIAFQIMHILRIPIPMNLVNPGELLMATEIVEHAKSRNIPLVLPKDVWCIKEDGSDKMKLFSVYSMPPGWKPTDIGPQSLKEMASCLSECKKVMWIGPLGFRTSEIVKDGIFQLAGSLDKLSGCEVTFVGKMESTEFLGKSKSFSNCNFLPGATVVWEALKGRKLPGLMALDRAYPFHIDWNAVYADPLRPLVVDIGSGNGLFLFAMARRKDTNFLGLEMNEKLVDRCLDDARCHEFRNLHFLATDATSTFMSVVSSYPGELILASIQCPNPDFNKPEYCWRMLRRSLVEAIIDKLVIGGKIFLQSDIEAVAIRMKEKFMEHSKTMLVILESHGDLAVDNQGWLKENPFGVPSSWEKHVLCRGDPMYRLLLSKIGYRR
ncbi:hypothetical protein M569_08579, partial [Genlisea aurea]